MIKEKRCANCPATITTRTLCSACYSYKYRTNQNRPKAVWAKALAAKQRLHDDLREVWATVTEQPGISVRTIAKEIHISHYRARKLVELLQDRKTGTLTGGEHYKKGTLRAPIPLLTIPYVPDTRDGPDMSGTQGKQKPYVPDI